MIQGISLDDEALGAMLRKASVEATQQLVNNPKPGFLIPYHHLNNDDRLYHRTVARLFIASVLEAMENRELVQKLPEGTIIGGH